MENWPVCWKKWVRRREVTPPRLSADNGEFTDPISRVAAKLPGETGRHDFASTILHEIGHAVGITEQQPNLRINDFLEVVPGNPVLKVFKGATTTATFRSTETRGLHLDNAVHFGDLMNEELPPDQRRLISDLDARILRDAYDYQITLPSTLQTSDTVTPQVFDANLDRAARVLTINGSVRDDDGSLDGIDDLTVTQGDSGSVFLLFRDDDQSVLVQNFPASLVREIRVVTGLGKDTINIESVSPGISVSVDAGPESDEINIAGTTGRLDRIESDVFVAGGPSGTDVGTDTLTINDAGNTAEATYVVNNGGFGYRANGLARNVFLSLVEEVSVTGGQARNTFDIRGTAAGTKTQLLGSLEAPDTFDVRSFAGTLDVFAGELTLIGRGGDDGATVHDENHAPASTYSVTDSLVARGAAKIHYSDVESVSLLGGRGDNTYNIESFDPTAPVSITGGVGADTFRLADGVRVAGRLDGGVGSDTLDYSAFTTPVNLHLVNGTATNTGRVAAIENAIGGSAGDNFVGDEADNIFLGNGGDDILETREGDDVAVGGDGDDTIRDTTVPVPGAAPSATS